MSKRKTGPGLNRSTAFDWINYAVMVLLAFIMVYPLWYCVAGSLNEGMDYLRGGVFLWPRKWTLANYKAVFLDSAILNAFWVTIWKCLVGTVTSVLCTAMVAYAITRPKLRLKKLYIPFIMLTMFFSGGLIPYFILIVDLGLYDSFWVYIIPTMFSAYNMIIIQSFMRELPSELIESAKLDGAREWQLFVYLALPVGSSGVIASLVLGFLEYWSLIEQPMTFLKDKSLYPLSIFLPDITNVGKSGMTFAASVVTFLPAVLVFLGGQDYLEQGIMAGAVKE